MNTLLTRVVATFAILGAATGSVFAQRLVTPLDADLQPLVSDFDARRDNARLVVILSPT